MRLFFILMAASLGSEHIMIRRTQTSGSLAWLWLWGCIGLLLTWHVSAFAQSQDFATWLTALRAEALQRGVRPQTLDAALVDVTPIPRIIELDRKQPETTLTYTQYMQRVLSDKRKRQGRHNFRKYQTLLNNIGTAYGVPPAVIVSLWGMETYYGRLTGGYPVIAALATLAYDGRRSAFFRRELLNALRILDEGHITPQAMRGSWAGAMGQNQFMPSSFLSRAVDYDGDGRRDIWTTLGDIFASTANYLSRAGWKQDEPWGQRVTLPDDFHTDLEGLDTTKTLSAWRALGIRQADGSALPSGQRQASLLLPEGSQGAAFLVYDNFRTILKWNRSHYFAFAVGQLADHVQTP
jgi:membrane-bound lytic murein transglycosylase B